MTKISRLDIERALSKVMHPEIKYSLVDLGMIKDVLYEQEKVSLSLKLPFLQVPVRELLIDSIKKKLSELDNSIRVEVNIEQMSQEELDKFKRMAKEGWKF